MFQDIVQNISLDWSKILKSINVYHTNEKWKNLISENMTWTVNPEFPLCKTLDMINHFDFENSTPSQIFINFHKMKNLGVSLFVEDRHFVLKRPLKERERIKGY